MSNPYPERLARLQAALQAAACDGMVVVCGASLRYLTGLTMHAHERLIVLLLPATPQPPFLVLPVLEQARASATLAAHGLPIVCVGWPDETGPTAALVTATAQLFGERPAPLLAVEHLAMRVMELRALEAVIPALHTTDATPLLAGLRMVKDADELAAMRAAVQIIEASLQQIIPSIKAGVTERELAAQWRAATLALGADEEAFGCIVASGPNSANPHHANSDRPFAPGDLIILDGGAVYQGYVSDITRTVALGTPSATARTIYDLVLAANTAGRAAVQPGTTGAAIDAATRAVIASGGYGEQFIHRTGHGIGMETHELPNIVAGSTTPLVAGMTFTIEPGIYLAGVGGVRIEDDLLVTATGGESLTTFPRELLVL